MISARTREIVEAYQRADHRRPTKEVADRFGITPQAVLYHVDKAREAGLLPPASRGRAVQFHGGHQPRTARWCDGESWTACSACRRPWPCPDADALQHSAGVA